MPVLQLTDKGAQPQTLKLYREAVRQEDTAPTDSLSIIGIPSLSFAAEFPSTD